MNAASQAAAPAIGMLKSIVTFMVITVIGYGGVLLYLRTKVSDRKRYKLYADLLSLAAIAIMGIFIFFKATHH